MTTRGKIIALQVTPGGRRISLIDAGRLHCSVAVKAAAELFFPRDAGAGGFVDGYG
jgi:hypothetical protein